MLSGGKGNPVHTGAGSRRGKRIDISTGFCHGTAMKILRTLTWIFHESEAFIGQAFKGAAVLGYRKALITKPPARLRVKPFWQFLNRVVVTKRTRSLPR
jgi:hypothetical protein